MNQLEDKPKPTNTDIGRVARALEMSGWTAQPLSARIATILIFVGFLSFIPLFFWNSRQLLMFAASLTWIGFVYNGLLMAFGARAAVLGLWWPKKHIGRLIPWQTEGVMLATMRVMGIVFVAFMIFAAHEIFQGGFTAAYNNFGR